MTTRSGERGAGEPRRIVVVATMTSPSGAPIAALRLAAGLAAGGHSVRALFLYRREEMNGADHPFECLLPHPPRGAVDHARIAARLLRVLRRERPDAVLGFLPLATVLGAAIGRAVGVPARIVSHRVPRQTYGGTMRRLDTAAARAGLYTDVVAVSGSVAASCAAYPQWLRARTVTVYNGLRGWCPSALSKPAARERLGLPRDARVVASVGRLDHQKNYPLLIAAMAATPSDCIAAIAGEGPLRDDLARRAENAGVADRIVFLGALPRDDVPHLLAAADVFAQTSTFEGQSNALLEALHAGLPCLVGDVAEQIETVRAENGAVAGAILPMGAPEAWAEAIGRLTDEGPPRSLAVETARERAEAFTFERMIGGFEAVFATAMARG